MKTKQLLFLFFLVICQHSFAQKETNWWYFGNNVGISFTGSGGTPVAQTNGKINSTEGVASISNSKGGLLFYTDGESVFNKQHATMSNGTGLNGHNSSTQSCVIVQQPVRGNRYYIFTTDQEWGSKGFQYSIVDTSLNGGYGQVVSKNASLLGKCAEKVSATLHANKVDTWVAAHSGDDNKFYVYKINYAGISSPVVSSVGPAWAMTGTNTRGYAKGYMKFSPDGTKLICAISGEQNSSGQYVNNAGRIEIYDFDNLTGVVSNPQIIDKSNIKSGVGNISAVYGVEFSPNGRFLYVSFYIPSYITSGSDGNDGLWQLDLSSTNANTIGASCVKVVNSFSTNSGGSMQLGPDGKIYLARAQIAGGAGYLSCIEKPNCKGSGCSFVDNAISLSGKKGGWGLPNFIASFLNKSIFDWGSSPSNLCENSSTKFYVLDSSGVDSAIWNFGDASTGKNNKAKGFTVYHKFSATKTFGVFLALYRKSPSTNCDADTGRKNVTIFSNPKPNLGNDTAICQGEEVLLIDYTSNATYLWTDNSTVPAYVANTKGWHWLDVRIGGCTKRDSMYLDVIEYPKFSLGKDTTFCNGDSLKLTVKDGQTFLWNNGKTTASIFVKDTGAIWVKASKGNCTASDTILIKKAAITANFNWGQNCSLIPTQFQYTGAKPIKTYFWDFNKESNSSLENPSKIFSTAGTKKVKLRIVSDKGCKDSIVKDVEIKLQGKADFDVNDVCQNDSVVFKNKSIVSTNYFWKFGDGDTSTKENPKHVYKISTSQTFNVTLVAIVKDGCSDSISKSVTINALPNSNFSFTMSGRQVNFTAAQSGNTKYRWLFGDGDSSYQANVSHTYKTSPIDTVCLKVINTAGCISETCKTIGIWGISKTTNSDFKIYPNPNTGNFTIEIENPEKDILIEVYNSVGSLVKTVEMVEKVISINMDVAAGIYLVKVKNGEVAYNQKVSIVQ